MIQKYTVNIETNLECRQKPQKSGADVNSWRRVVEWAEMLPQKIDEDPDGDNEDGDNGQRVWSKDKGGHNQGCISCGILLSGTGARGVSSEHMENVEMFSCSPT